jgi:hypothetical protein
MPTDILEHTETGEVYHKAFKLMETPIPDILAMLALGGIFTLLALWHSPEMSSQWPSPIVSPYIRHAEQIVKNGWQVSADYANLMPFYSYLIAGFMALKGTTAFSAYSTWLLSLNIGAYVLSMMMMYNVFRQGMNHLSALLIVLLIGASPLVLTTVTALSPAPLVWVLSLTILMLLQVLQQNKNLFICIVGSLLAFLAAGLHPFGLSLLASWGICLLCLGFVGMPMLLVAFSILFGTTLPTVNLIGSMASPYAYLPKVTDGMGVSSILAPLAERIQGFFSGVHQLGKVLLMAPDPNLQEWPMQQVQNSWFAQLLNQAYLGLSGLAILAWPLGTLFAVLAMIKALYTFIHEREVIGGLFLTWTLLFAVATTLIMPKLVTGSILSLVFLLPLVFIFSFLALRSLSSIPLLKWLNPPLRFGVIGLATVCVLLFQARVTYNELAAIYEPQSTTTASQALVAIPQNIVKEKAYGLVAVSGASTGAKVATKPTLNDWVQGNVPSDACFLSNSPVQDGYLVGRSVYVLGSPYAETGIIGMGVDVASAGFACPYFIEHKNKRTEYDWIRQEQFRRNGVRVVFDDANAQGVRIWKLGS